MKKLLFATAMLAATAAAAAPGTDTKHVIETQGRAAMASIQAELADGVSHRSVDRLATLDPGATLVVGATPTVGATLPVATNEIRSAAPTALDHRGF